MEVRSAWMRDSRNSRIKLNIQLLENFYHALENVAVPLSDLRHQI